MMELRDQALERLDPRVERPPYDRRALRRSIVHIGVGGFHRAHLASYVDDLARAGHTGWGIVGAGVLPHDEAMATALTAQDGLYTLVTRSEQGAQARVIGSLLEYVLAVGDLEPLVARIATPSTQIVSLTVTEGGYPVDDATGTFVPDSPNAAEDSAFAALVRGLRRRRDEGVGPLTVLSCDNVIGNGTVTRTAALGVAAALDPGLAGWIEEVVTFPNSMVDRITPQTTDADRDWLAAHFDVHDRWPVMTEPFRQWVVEDRFAADRLPLEDLDVIVTHDVEPYELFKLRLLNAAHSSLAYLARLLRIDLVDQVMAEPRFAAYVRALLETEAGPVVPRAPGIDLQDYIATLMTRFANPAIGDQVRRLCLDGSPKFPKFLLPTVRAQLARGGPVQLSALALAGWCAYLTGRGEDGAALDLSPDPLLEQAQRHAREAEQDPMAFLRFHQVFGDDLPQDERFTTAFAHALTSLRTVGVRASLDAAVDRAGAP